MSADNASRGRANRRKGKLRENETVARFLAAGIHAKRISRTGEPSDDIAVYAPWRNLPDGQHFQQLIGECKQRKTGAGFKKIEEWKAGKDLLFLWRDRAEPLVVMDLSLLLKIMGSENV